MPNKPPNPPNTARSDPTRAQATREVVAAASSEKLTVSSGPIPTPETLAAYDKAIPGLGERIIASYEAEYSNRHRLEQMSLQGDIDAMKLAHWDVRRGQWLGFVISITGILSGAILVYLNHDVAGASLGGLSLASLLTAFLKSSPSNIEPGQAVEKI